MMGNFSPDNQTIETPGLYLLAADEIFTTLKSP